VKPDVIVTGGPGVCGCDGQYKTNQAELHAAGVDVNMYGGCSKDTPDEFVCGDISCKALTESCMITPNDAIDPANPDNPEFYASCGDLPVECPTDGTATCSCIPDVAMQQCSAQSGNIMLFFPGG